MRGVWGLSFQWFGRISGYCCECFHSGCRRQRTLIHTSSRLVGVLLAAGSFGSSRRLCCRSSGNSDSRGGRGSCSSRRGSGRRHCVVADAGADVIAVAIAVAVAAAMVVEATGSVADPKWLDEKGSEFQCLADPVLPRPESDPHKPGEHHWSAVPMTPGLSSGVSSFENCCCPGISVLTLFVRLLKCMGLRMR